MVACCSVTYLCISHFAPYIYSHDLAEVEELADMLSEELSHIPKEEVQYFIQGYNDILTRQYDNEFAFHLFQNSGKEIALPDINKFTGNKIDDYKSTDTTGEYEISFVDSTETYILLLAKNTNKRKSSGFSTSKNAAYIECYYFIGICNRSFFYTWYMTKPIKKISKLSKQMADMNFSGLCPTNRTDEIGVLSL